MRGTSIGTEAEFADALEPAAGRDENVGLAPLASRADERCRARHQIAGLRPTEALKQVIPLAQQRVLVVQYWTRGRILPLRDQPLVVGLIEKF